MWNLNSCWQHREHGTVFPVLAKTVKGSVFKITGHKDKYMLERNQLFQIRFLVHFAGKRRFGGSAKSLNKWLAGFCVRLGFLYLRAQAANASCRENGFSLENTQKTKTSVDASLCSCLYNLCIFHASLQAPALVVERSWSPFCSSCLIWGSTFSMWWQGDPHSQGCPRSATLMLFFHSHYWANFILARQCYFLALLISAPASSGLI